MKDFPAIKLEKVAVSLGGVSILENVNADIQRGAITAIIGPNGAGKTTLLLAILGLLKFTGNISFFNVDGAICLPKIGYVPQNLTTDRQSSVTVLEFMALEMQTRPLWMGVKASAREHCREALRNLEAAHVLDHPLGKLSGGEMQRVLLALALYKNPDLLFLDEPISGVDIAGGHLFCDVLEKLKVKKKMSILMVSHDLSVVSQHADRVLCLNHTVACEGSTPEFLTSEQLFAIYGLHSGLYEHHPSDATQACRHHHDVASTEESHRHDY